MTPRDEMWMRMALDLAGKAAHQDEVPVGAILVHRDAKISEGWNRSIAGCDPTAHAEIVALRAGGQRFQNYRLPDTTLYVSLEPCVMCMGAIVHARVRRLVFGAPDPRRGAAGGVLGLHHSDFLNHHVEVTGHVLAEECSRLLRAFFAQRR